MFVSACQGRFQTLPLFSVMGFEAKRLSPLKREQKGWYGNQHSEDCFLNQIHVYLFYWINNFKTNIFTFLFCLHKYNLFYFPNNVLKVFLTPKRSQWLIHLQSNKEGRNSFYLLEEENIREYKWPDFSIAPSEPLVELNCSELS